MPWIEKTITKPAPNRSWGRAGPRLNPTLCHHYDQWKASIFGVAKGVKRAYDNDLEENALEGCVAKCEHQYNPCKDNILGKRFNEQSCSIDFDLDRLLVNTWLQSTFLHDDL